MKKSEYFLNKFIFCQELSKTGDTFAVKISKVVYIEFFRRVKEEIYR